MQLGVDATFDVGCSDGFSIDRGKGRIFHMAFARRSGA